MHNEIERVFGEPIFRHIQAIAEGNENTLLTLPKHLIKKLTTYLSFKDVTKLSTLSHVAKEVFNGDNLWEVLYKRHKMGLVYKDEREQGYSYGWKRLFKERQMHKPARNRQMKKTSSDHRLVDLRSSADLTKRPSISLPFKNQKGTTSDTKLLGTKVRTPKFMGLNSNTIVNGRPIISKKNNPEVGIRGCKLLSMQKAKGEDNSFVKKNTLSPFHEVKVKCPEKPEKDPSLIFKSGITGGSREKCNVKGVFENKIKSRTMLKSSDVKINSDRKDCNKKSETSLKKSGGYGRKPTSSGRVKSEVALNIELKPTRFIQKTFTRNTNIAKDPQNSGKPEVLEMAKSLHRENHEVSSKADFGIEESIRTRSITEKYSSSENCLHIDLGRDRNNYESNSNLKRKSEQKIATANFCVSQNKPTVYEKFATPKKPSAETKTNEIASTVESHQVFVQKFADIKAYLKCNSKNLSVDEPKLDDRKADVKSRSIKKVPDNAATRYTGRIFLKTESCNGLDSKFVSVESSQRFRPKKRGNLKKFGD